MRAQRTLTGPNARTGIPSGWTGSTYTPSDEYFWNRGFQWGSIYEDDITIHVMRFMKEYLESSGAQVFLSRELSDDAGPYDYQRFGYPNAAFPLPKKQVASKYYLEEHGVPRWVWDEPSLSAQSDKDIRARPYYANHVGADLSISLHTNAFGDGGARGTETFWYTAKYPHLQESSKRFAAALNDGAVKSIREYFDDGYGRQAYVNPYPALGVPEWPYYAPYVSPFDYGGYNKWNDRGVKTSNLGELREAQMPAALIELAFHDSWKWYPDNLFLQDPIFQATSAWGMYEGVCRYFGITPKPRLDSKLVAGKVPALVGPNQVLNASVTFQNEGMTWNWGRRQVNGVYAPYTVWQLRALEGQSGAVRARAHLHRPDGHPAPGGHQDVRRPARVTRGERPVPPPAEDDEGGCTRWGLRRGVLGAGAGGCGRSGGLGLVASAGGLPLRHAAHRVRRRGCVERRRGADGHARRRASYLR